MGDTGEVRIRFEERLRPLNMVIIPVVEISSKKKVLITSQRRIR
jgi:hypothetical protein